MSLISPQVTGSTSYPTGLRVAWKEGVGTGYELDWSSGLAGFRFSASYRMSTIYTVVIESPSTRAWTIPRSYLTNGETYMVFVEAIGSENVGDSLQGMGSATFSYDDSNPTCPPPITGPNFLLCEYDDDGETADFVTEDSAVFVTDSASWECPNISYQYASTTIELGSEDIAESDYSWEFITTGYWRGWQRLTLKNLSPGTTYSWKATPWNADKSVAANPIEGEFTTDGGARKLSAPTGLNVSNIELTTSTLNWNAVANASGYIVQWRKVGDDSWNIVNS